MSQTLIKCVAILSILALASCSEKTQQVDEILTKDSLPDFEAKGIKILYTDSALAKMEIEAPNLVDYSQAAVPHTLFPKGVKGIFFNDKGENISSLKAQFAYYDPKLDLWEFKRKVVVINPQGDTLSTDHLWADRKKETLHSDTTVSIAFKDKTSLKGTGFNSNFNFTKYTFKNVLVSTTGGGW